MVGAGEGQGPDLLRVGSVTDIVDECARHRPLDRDRRHAPRRGGRLTLRRDGKDRQPVAREEECPRRPLDPGLGDDRCVLSREGVEDDEGLP